MTKRMLHRAIFAILIVCFAGISQVAQAQLRRSAATPAPKTTTPAAKPAVAQPVLETSPEKLPDLVTAAKDELKPVGDDEVAKAKARLSAAVATLDRMLTKSPRNGPGWKTHLRWDDLQAQLAGGAAPDFSVLRDVYRRFTRNTPGLELPQFAGVANSLREYVYLAAADASPDQQALLNQQLDTLAESIKSYNERPSSELQWQIGQVVGWLGSIDRAPAIVQSLRKVYSQPNGFAELSPQLVEAGFKDKIDRVESITDEILGTSISGTGHTVGTLSTHLIPDKNRAIVELYLRGVTETTTVGYNGPVAIHSVGSTQIAARKWILIDQKGVRTVPATSDAITNSEVVDIDGGKLVTRIAWKKVGQKQGEANAVAAEHAKQRIRDRVDQEAGQKVAKANTEFQDKFRLPLLRRDQFPELLKISTSSDALSVTALQSSKFQLGAPTAPPAAKSGHDLTARVHESFFNNLAEAMLAGETLKSEEVRAEIIKRRGSLPEEFKEGEDEEPWSITFAAQRPIIVELADQGFHVVVQGQRYTSGDRKFDAMNITANYKIELTPSGAKYVRQGELKILPPKFVEGKDRLSIGQQSLVTILQKKFARMFKEEIVSEGLELPGMWKRAGKLRPVEMTTADGWLVAGWVLPSSEKTADKNSAKTANREATKDRE